MKTTTKFSLALLALGASACFATAQDASGQPQDGQDRSPMRGHRPPPPPVIIALDANHDGVIDATEIANASNALLTLDKNGDGQLTRDELRPPRPEGMPPRGPRPDGNGPDGEQSGPQQSMPGNQ